MTKSKTKATAKSLKTAAKAKKKIVQKATAKKKPAVKAKTVVAPKKVKPAVQPAKAAAKPVHKPEVKAQAHAPQAHKPAAPAPKPQAPLHRPEQPKAHAPQAHRPAQPVQAPVATHAPITHMADKPVVATPAAKKLLFKVNELIVYPAHGVGRVVMIEEQEIAGIKLELYIVDFEKEKLRLKVPTSKSEQKGMRKLADKPLIEHAMKVLKGRARIKRTMWSRRAQEYEAKINSGDLIAVAEVVRDLYRSERQPEQSYSERQLFEQALDRMAREIAAVKKIDDDMAVKEIETFLAKNAHRNTKADDGVPAEEAA
ncbi:CarD family transcriptional regulator [Aestuariivirga sp. YIM B02566]|uniref:CarD family transcriptional regulator n=1 Tax=Taklimakanibacter albus TaxID=2800327 RepID=A0ACC5R695_9HYPH|nr:CarD family transcriptional regulator [Aestuariivirga sp. YIM B02566]MBK1868186.1 CarD family transcriptional regulator [Aestuariivirga sp. YIM B02566]